MRVTDPRSTAPSRLSCWAFEKRWISSMKRTARVLNMPCLSALSMTSRTSFTPLLMALSWWNGLPVASAMRRANVVFPTPGGPHRIMEGS